MSGDINTIQKESVWVNRFLKEVVLDYGISDAALYLGDGGNILRHSTEAAICIMIRDALVVSDRNNDDNSVCDLANLSDYESIRNLNLSFVSKSLGSRILMDSLMPLSELNTTYDYSRAVKLLNPNMDNNVVLSRTLSAPENEREKQAIQTKKAIAQSLSNTYMLASQLPLLGIGNVAIEQKETLELRDALYCSLVLGKSDGNCETPIMLYSGEPKQEEFSNGLEFFSFVDDVAGSLDDIKNNGQKMNIYALRDPNDLLGYQAVRHLKGDAGPGEPSVNAYKHLNIFEIKHRNAREWFWSLANPKEAHANEDRRKQSLALIWCGGTVEADGKLNTKSCPTSNIP